ncbi:MAG TPA: tyrosine-type recombinase/integrase, partial [Pyrinomonadaceae bacterium]
MAKRRKGYVFQEASRWYARFTYTDGSGKRRNVKWRVNEALNKTEAEDELMHVLRSFEGRGERALDGNRLLFRDLAHVYADQKLIPPQYVGDRKVAGLRSWRTPQGFLRILIEHFGARRIKDIRHGDIERFKLLRLNTPTVRGEQRTIASVNRELELLRSMLRYAKREGWLEQSPFEAGSVLISKADETERMRILTQQEESALLAACKERREHLRPLLIAALDTAMRRGELLKLQWADVDLVKCTIIIRSMNTKTARTRKVGITSRLARELEKLYE